MNNETAERPVKLITSNKKAYYEFEVIRKIETGIELKGTEVKSLRMGKCSIQESYAGFKGTMGDELYIFNMHIKEYEFGNRENHEPMRPRKLLVHKPEAVKLQSAVNEKGITLIPLKIYFSGPYVKLEIGLCKAKKKYDKREDKKKKDMDREIRKNFKI